MEEKPGKGEHFQAANSECGVIEIDKKIQMVILDFPISIPEFPISNKVSNKALTSMTRMIQF